MASLRLLPWLRDVVRAECYEAIKLHTHAAVRMNVNFEANYRMSRPNMELLLRTALSSALSEDSGSDRTGSRIRADDTE